MPAPSRRMRRTADRSDEPRGSRDELHGARCRAIMAAMKRTLIAVGSSVLIAAAHAASVAPVAAENGMVVPAQHIATHVGVDVLKKGGNAVDAAVAGGCALAVVYTAAGNLGGGGFMTIQL